MTTLKNALEKYLLAFIVLDLILNVNRSFPLLCSPFFPRVYDCPSVVFAGLAFLCVGCWLQLSLSKPGDTYTVSGYAYGGGGIGLTRVEVSFNDGEVKISCTNID